jgi:hypothetical protein
LCLLPKTIAFSVEIPDDRSTKKRSKNLHHPSSGFVASAKDSHAARSLPQTKHFDCDIIDSYKKEIGNALGQTPPVEFSAQPNVVRDGVRHAVMPSNTDPLCSMLHL